MTDTTDTTDTEDRPKSPPTGVRRRRVPRLKGLRLRRRRPALGSEWQGSPAHRAAGWRPEPRTTNPIVPPQSMARRALLALVGIMSFLACLSVGAVSLVNDRAHGWQRQIAAEVTIQVRPDDEGRAEERVARAADIALQVPGVTAASPLSEDDAAALLAPWLGRDFDRSELPVPRLIAVQVTADADLATLARRLRDEVDGASLDDHGLWLERLSSMASVVVLIGSAVVALVLAATALSVVFATRGAMAGNREVIAVLHFVGAEDSYVAAEFQRHFLLLGLKGAGLGGAAAIALFLMVSWLSSPHGPTPEEAQLRSLFGGFTVGPPAYIGALATVVLIAVLIAATARITVRRTLTDLG
jgi:cell division transport system permease protein